VCFGVCCCVSARVLDLLVGDCVCVGVCWCLSVCVLEFIGLFVRVCRNFLLCVFVFVGVCCCVIVCVLEFVVVFVCVCVLMFVVV